MQKHIHWILLALITIVFSFNTSCIETNPYTQQTPDIIFSSTISSHNNHINNNNRYGLRPTQPHYHTYQHPHYAYMSAADFQQTFQQTQNEYDILNNYELYAFPNFCTLDQVKKYK